MTNKTCESIKTQDGFMEATKERIETTLDKLLRSQNTHANEIYHMMRYTTLHSGKRLRALLAYATASTISAPIEEVDIIASAIECLHSFSLIHDDLPAMDDDIMRRGKPTCHVQFGEAQAVLTGDALQAFAFELLATNNTPSFVAEQRLNIIQLISQSVGPDGMIAGQALDITQDKPNDLKTLELQHHLKTGLLISASINAITLLKPGLNDITKQSLQNFATAIGLAFQIQDDILDITQPSDQLGKTAGKDIDQNKLTYPNVMGLTLAKQQCQIAYDKAIKALHPIENKAQELIHIANHIIHRDY